MKQTSIILSFLLLSLWSAAEDSKAHYEELYNIASEKYSNGEFEAAAQLYMKILEAGYESPALYYNLGNACFKQNNIPATVLNYERAKRLAPNDADILFNLELANQRIVDKIESIPLLFYQRWWNSFVDTAGADEWGYAAFFALAAGMLFLTFFMLAARPVLKKFWFCGGVLCIFFSLVFMVCGTRQMSASTNQSHAIVFAPTVTVISSPDANGKSLFVIHEGVKVELLETVEGWHRVKVDIPNKIDEGWLSAADVEII